jgi:hypothetical protein
MTHQSRQRRRIVLLKAALTGAIVALAAPAAALASGAVDQQQTQIGTAIGQIGTWDGDGHTPTWQAQTFVAGFSGPMDQIDLPLRVVGNPIVPLTVEIRTTSGGQPSGTSIGGASVAQSSVMACACLQSDFTTFRWDSITLTSPATLAAGTQYAIVLSAPGAAGTIFGIGDQNGSPTRDVYEWAGVGSDPYAAGTHWSQVFGWEDNLNDSAFKTYVAGYAATVQAPINADGSSNFKAKGSVPVRFSLSLNGSPTCSMPPATIAVTRTNGAQSGPINEDTYIFGPDNGSNFRIAGCQYAYNLDAKGLGAGTYRVDIKIGGQTVGSAAFELR